MRAIIGYQLHRVQCGAEPVDWKPMASIGPGVRELRVRVDGAWRLVYLATRPEGVYVLHAFQKKTKRTTREDIELAKERWRHIATFRGGGK